MRFHRAIIDAAGTERMTRAYASVQSEILLCMVQLRPHYDRPAEVAAEHRGADRRDSLPATPSAPRSSSAPTSTRRPRT